MLLKDYTFKNPQWDGEYHDHARDMEHQVGKYHHYDYPGRYKSDIPGKDFANWRVQALRNDAHQGEGASNCPVLQPGVRFTLENHPLDTLNTRWQITQAVHSGQQPQALETESGGLGTTLVSQFAFIPDNQTWRPLSLPKPRIDGAQIAIVTGPEGEEIFCDEYGRVKVHFLWDRYDNRDDNSSCWVRVSHPWAGQKWGMSAIPRIGHEVIVEFLNGDPDQPVIIGRTYHSNNLPPGDLPATKTQMTIRSKTHKGEGFNELRFEDQKAQEEIYMHAQKDHRTEILNDQFHTIGHNRTKSVGVDQQEEIGQDKRTNVGRDHFETIGNNSVIRVVKDQEIQVDNNRTLIVNSSKKNVIYADSIEEIGGHSTVEIQGVLDEKVNTKIFSRSKRYIMHAEDEMVVAGPGGSLTINSSGVTIKAKKLSIQTPSMNITGGGVDQVEALTAMVNEGAPFCEICAKAKNAAKKAGK